MEEPTTLCYCPSCVSERDNISACLKEMPPSVKQSAIANYLNVRYEQMREKCEISKKIAEDSNIYRLKECENNLSLVAKWGFYVAIAVCFYIGIVYLMGI